MFSALLWEQCCCKVAVEESRLQWWAYSVSVLNEAYCVVVWAQLWSSQDNDSMYNLAHLRDLGFTNHLPSMSCSESTAYNHKSTPRMRPFFDRTANLVQLLTRPMQVQCQAQVKLKNESKSSPFKKANGREKDITEQTKMLWSTRIHLTHRSLLSVHSIAP